MKTVMLTGPAAPVTTLRTKEGMVMKDEAERMMRITILYK